MFSIVGGCHCENVQVELGLTRQPGSYGPRVCDCDFCIKHGAEWISDPSGTLHMRVRDGRWLGRYKQGSGTADCLLCTRCGVLVAVVYQEGDTLYAVVNSRVLGGAVSFAAATPVSPQTLEPAEKVSRWKALWFPDVELSVEG